MHIKWHWGTKITIVIILFVSFMLGMVYMTTQNPIILVEKDYYPKGLRYQDKIDHIKNAIPFKSNMKLEQTKDEIVLQIPNASPDSGTVVFYRPNEEKVLDYVHTFSPHTPIELLFPKKNFKLGVYVLKISWWQNGKGYFIEKKIFLV